MSSVFDGNLTHIFLPSSSPSVGSINTLSHYACNLQTMLRLENSTGIWEVCLLTDLLIDSLIDSFIHCDHYLQVALTKLVYPRTIQNIYSGEFSYFSYVLNMQIDSRLAAGSYSDMNELLLKLNAAMKPDESYYQWKLDTDSHRVILHMTKPTGAPQEPYVVLGRNLRLVLGFSSTKIEGCGYSVAGYTYSLHAGNQIFFVYAPGLIETSFVGDVSAEILGVVPYQSTGVYGEEVIFEPKNLLFQRVKQVNISEIRIELRNRFGDYLPFASGSSDVIAVLSFRKMPKYVL